MAVEVRVDTAGLDSLVKSLSPQEIQALLRRAGFEAEGLAKGRAPVDTGFLRGSITTDASKPGEVSVGASALYAPYVEQGTRNHRAQPYLQPAVQKAADALRAALEARFRKVAR